MRTRGSRCPSHLGVNAWTRWHLQMEFFIVGEIVVVRLYPKFRLKTRELFVSHILKTQLGAILANSQPNRCL